MKRNIAILIGIALIAVIAIGCTKTGGGGSDGAQSGKRIFMSSAYYTSPYGAPLQEAVRARAAELGYGLQIVDGEENADKQLSQFKAAFADGYDGFIYWPGDQASTPPIVEYLNSTGKPWVVINTVVDTSVQDKVPCTVASNEVEIGRWLGRLALEYFDKNPSVPKSMVYIEGSPGASYTENLTIGLNEIISGKGITILNDRQFAQYDPSKAMTIMEDLITKYGKKFSLVIAQDGGMFQGAYAALESAGYLGKVGVICQGQDLIVKDKLLTKELYASVAQDPFEEGSLSVIMLDKLIKGESVEKWVETPTGPIYAADVDKYHWF